jgi:hypothetical protein
MFPAQHFSASRPSSRPGQRPPVQPAAPSGARCQPMDVWHRVAGELLAADTPTPSRTPWVLPDVWAVLADGDADDVQDWSDA